MPQRDLRRLMQRTRELMSKSREICECSRRAIRESTRLEERLGIPHPKFDQRRKRLLEK